MPQTVHTIRLELPFRMGSVNCYLVDTGEGFILIDTGCSNNRRELEEALESSGCRPGSLKVIVLTHGDFDHTGNAAYLREKYGAPILMHAEDAAMVSRGDMFINRKKVNFLIRKLVPFLSGFGQAECFEPDETIGDGEPLATYGLHAVVIAIPGHSPGSIGILTAEGDLFCGDLLEMTDRPRLGTLMDDMPNARISAVRLKSLAVHHIYPGHGGSFSMEQYLKASQAALLAG